MFIGHLPAGYLITRALARSPALTSCATRGLLAAGLLGSVFPDVDLFYFYLIDHRQTHHHLYWTHWPVFWLALLACAMVGCTLAGKRHYLSYVYVFVLNIVVHLLLDTIVGDIWWLAPALMKPFALFNVPALYQPWILNFLLHWSFLLELALLAAAFAVFHKHRFTTQG